jgi:hypothetical protein
MDDDTETDYWTPLGTAVLRVIEKLGRGNDLAFSPSPTPSKDHPPRPYERGGDANDERGDDSDNEEPIHIRLPRCSPAALAQRRMASSHSMQYLTGLSVD